MTLYNYIADDTVNTWVQEVSGGKSHIPLDLEKSLILEYQSIDTSPPIKERALKELIAYNASSLASIVLKVYHSTRGAKNIEVVDLLQEAVTIFIYKLEKFDLSHNVRLITYYTRDVKTTIQRYIASHAFSVRQGSVYLQGIAAQISEARRTLEADTGVVPSQDEIAKKLSLSKRTLAMVEEFTGVIVVPVQDNLGRLSSEDPEERKGAELLFEVLSHKLEMLSERDFRQIYINLSIGADVPLDLLKHIKDIYEPR